MIVGGRAQHATFPFRALATARAMVCALLRRHAVAMRDLWAPRVPQHCALRAVATVRADQTLRAPATPGGRVRNAASRSVHHRVSMVDRVSTAPANALRGMWEAHVERLRVQVFVRGCAWVGVKTVLPYLYHGCCRWLRARHMHK